MNSATAQVQLKVSLSQQLSDLLQSQAARVGLPATQFVKYLIVKAVEDQTYPVFPASDWTQERVKKAIKEMDGAVEVKDIHKFFQDLQ